MEGGYKSMPFFKQSEIIYDFTVDFCHRYIDLKSRTKDQTCPPSLRSGAGRRVVQAARSGKQNTRSPSLRSGLSGRVAEGYLQKSIESRIKLLGVSRGSLEELLNDYQDLLRQRNLNLWTKDSSEAKVVRNLVSVESAANCMVCLINQTNQLLDHPSSTLATPVVYVHASWWRDYGAGKLRWLEERFVKEGGFRENLFKKRINFRKTQI